MTTVSRTDLDQVWNTLQREAVAIREAEPCLAPILDRTVLRAPSLPHALARLLAPALSCRDMNEGAVRATLFDIVDDDPSIAVATARDLRKVRSEDQACGTHLYAFINGKGFHALQSHRIAHRLWRMGRCDLAAWLSNRASRVFGADIHPAARLGPAILLDHGSGIVIGETAVVEGDAQIHQNVTLGGTGKALGDRHPKLRRGVMIGAGASILGNVEIGAGSKVGAGSVVLEDVPPGCTVAGVPARIMRRHGSRTHRGDAPAGSNR